MGLMVHSLEGIPDGHHRDYFIYLLDYGWHEPLSQALRDNFGRMATLASEKKNAVVIMRTDEGIHFSDEVLSWHSINGENAEREELLPAILVTNKHPAAFRRRNMEMPERAAGQNFKLVLFPLRKHCKNTTEVVELIQKIFSKIKQGQDLDEFSVIKERKKGIGGALVNSVILEPNIAGIGFSFNKLISYLKGDK
ncbi:MAG: hypothetical protein JST70_17110 [Bacteroidetes bacterium]|nr:hypothetical protein [Bacteroidota bacterium]